MRFRTSGCVFVAALVAALLAPHAAQAQASKPAPEDPDYWRQYQLGLEYDPIGYTIKPNRFLFSGYTPMQPAGFRSDKYSHYFNPAYGLGDGWEATLGVTGAEAIGAGGEAIFYSGGVQKQLVRESGWRPAVSVGGYGYVGPHEHHGGTAYVVGSKRLWRGIGGSQALFGHAGLKMETWDASRLDGSTGLRPFVGANVGLTRRVFLSLDFSPRQAWQVSNPYSLGATVLVYKSVGVSGGVRNNGYRTEPFLSLTF